MLNFLTLAIGLLIPSAAESGTALEIKRGVAQLFVDDFLIDSPANLKRTLHQPRKDNGGNVPVLALSKEMAEPGGRSLFANGSIVFDSRLKRYVMIAKVYPSRHRFRFTSTDALHWVHGDDGTPQPVTIDVSHPAAPGRTADLMGFFCLYYDAADERYPYKGQVTLEHWADDLDGIFFIRSSDGINWERGRKVLDTWSGGNDRSCREIHQNGRVLRGPSDVNLFAYDPVENRFLGLFKFYGPRSRAYAFLDRLDEPFDAHRIEHVELVPPLAEANGDLPHDEYYAATAWRYESLWLGGLKVWHGGGNYPYSAAGCAFLKLVVSRDGLHWEKVPFRNDDGFPEVFIANGPEGGNNGHNDGGYVTEFSQGPLRVGDELIYYYASTSYGKNHPRGGDRFVVGGGIFRARLRVDGFVSVDGGTLTTKPLTLKFQGTRLFVNSKGTIMVSLMDASGKKLGAVAIEGDSLRHEVSFGGRSLGQTAPGDVARLQFVVRENGELYSFTVR